MKDYFSNLFQPGQSDFTPIMELITPRVNEIDNEVLTKSFTITEFKKTLLDMHPDKARWIESRFLQKKNGIFVEWKYTQQEEREREKGGIFPSQLTDTNIVLILKIENSISFKDFRPISLCNVIYKIIAKVLANHLKCVLPKCVSAE